LICRILGVTIGLFLLTGCASRVALRAPQGERWSPEQILHLHLDRSVAWESLFATLSVTLQVKDDSYSASGSFQYLSGERMGFQFRRPYRFVLGDIFLTPTEFIYWAPFSSPQVITNLDTLHVARFFPFDLPDWDLRDVMPFPLGSRSGGFQLDTAVASSDMYVLSGHSGGAAHRLVASACRAEILREKVERDGREVLIKTFRKYEVHDGWLVPVEVTCSTEDARVSLTWKIKKPVLRATPRGSQESM
jgi:hypothetical protein